MYGPLELKSLIDQLHLAEGALREAQSRRLAKQVRSAGQRGLRRIGLAWTDPLALLQDAPFSE